MKGNYDRILNKISKASGLSEEDIKEKIKAKREKLSGLISKEGAAQLIASELGISFEDEVLKIEELLPGMRKVNTIGKILSTSPIRKFQTKNGEESKVMNLFLADDSSNMKVVIWDTNLIALFEKNEIGEGDVIEISNGSMRDSELHLGSFSEMKKSDKVFEKVKEEKVVPKKSLSDIKRGESVSLRAFIVQVFEPNFFYVCSECGKKANQEGENYVCKIHGKVVPEKRAVMNIVIDDGSENIRVVLFHEKISELGINLESENWEGEKEKILGKEMNFIGDVRNNNYFNNLEIILEKANEIDFDNTIKEMENSNT